MEGPGAHAVADELTRFAGQRVESADGTADQPLARLEGRTIDDVRAVKKRLFLDANDVHVVVHFLMYGSYRVNEARDLDERLELVCEDDALRIYSCSVKVLTDGDPDLAAYDHPEADVLSPAFDREGALAALADRDDPIVDVLLDQSVFGGVGNRIKNEVLWQERIHPETPAAGLSRADRERLVDATVAWTREWYDHKQAGESMTHEVYRHDTCTNCDAAIERADLGDTERVTYWCPTCQPPDAAE